MGQRRRVLVVDGSQYFGNPMWRMLIPQTGFEIIGLARNNDEALEMSIDLRPDIILLDISHSKTRGLKTIKLLHMALPTVPIVTFTPIASGEYTQATLNAGASACFAKSEIVEALLQTMWTLIPSYMPMTGHILSQGVEL